MHEVEALRFNPPEQRTSGSGVNRVPPHVGQYWRLELRNRPRPLPKAWGVDPVFQPALKHDLKADTNAEHGSSAGNPLVDDLFAPNLPQTSHHSCESTNTGDHEAVRLEGFLTVVGQQDICASVLESFES
jgi:hypothetical protein